MGYWIIRDERGLFHKYKLKKFKNIKKAKEWIGKQRQHYLWTAEHKTKRSAIEEMEKRYDKPKGYFTELK